MSTAEGNKWNKLRKNSTQNVNLVVIIEQKSFCKKKIIVKKVNKAKCIQAGIVSDIKLNLPPSPTSGDCARV